MIKKFIRNPASEKDFDKISWCIHVAQEISGAKIEKETVLETFENFDIDVSDLERESLLSMVEWNY